MNRSAMQTMLACACAGLLVCGLSLGTQAAEAASKDTKPAASQEKKSLSGARNVPTRINADGMTYNADQRQVTFTTNVHVARPDFEMWSNKLIVHLKPAQKSAQAETNTGEASPVPEGLAAGDIDRIVATGNVRMKREHRSSLSEKATYTVDTEILLLEGNPRLTDGENTIAGEIVRYFMKENRSDVVGSPKKQVEAVFSTSGSSNDSKDGKDSKDKQDGRAARGGTR